MPHPIQDSPRPMAALELSELQAPSFPPMEFEAKSSPSEALAATLLKVESLTDTATLLLVWLRQTALQTLAQGRQTRTAQLMDVSLHMRSASHYRGYLGLGGEGHQLRSGPPSGAQQSMSRVWSALLATSERVVYGIRDDSITLKEGLLLPRTSPRDGHARDKHDATRGRGTSADATRLRANENVGTDSGHPEATHLLAFPLKRSDREPLGMVTLTLSTPDAVDARSWETCLRALDPLILTATPWLLLREQFSVASVPSLCAEFAEACADPVQDAPSSGPTLPLLGSALKPIEGLLKAYAPLGEPLMIVGPEGSGRRLLARWFHQQSRQAQGPFEVLDLCSVPTETQVAELFGWKHQPQPLDDRSHEGAIGRAEKGTLLLIGVDRLTMAAQLGLLTLLQSQRYQRVGEPAPRRASVRLVVACTADLASKVAAGTFREDLFWSLGRMPVHLPSMAHRGGEMRDWAAYFLGIRREELGLSPALRLGESALRQLALHDFHHNLNLLDKGIRKVVTHHLADPFATDEIPGETVTRALSGDKPAQASTLDGRLQAVARAYVQEALKRQAQGETLSLEVAEQFAGLVLVEAVEATGSRRNACQVLGLQKVLDGRNDARLFSRQLTAFTEACRANGLASLANRASITNRVER